ncbi:MAG: Sua5/YciO/YrdC/YwlC family protein, partial [Elusimicrobia bacterium]|nr:Sua5/YciO/YrdC/YwlC family protein [Elusimicrobiota bacterium]
LTDAAEVIRQFDGAVDWIVDAGPVAGAASTIVDATGSSPRLLREGRLSAADILSAGANR